MIRSRFAILAGALAVAAAIGIGQVAAVARAQDAQHDTLAAGGEAGRADAAEERSQSFQAVRGAVKEDVAGGPLLLIAYGAIWIVMLLYVIRLVRLQQRVQSDVERLERVLAQGTAPR